MGKENRYRITRSRQIQTLLVFWVVLNLAVKSELVYKPIEYVYSSELDDAGENSLLENNTVFRMLDCSITTRSNCAVAGVNGN